MTDLYLPADVLDEIAEAMQGFNDKRCVVTRPVTELDAAGMPIDETFETVGAFACRLEPSGAQAERLAGSQLAAEADYVIPAPRGVTITNSDVIEVAGLRLEVIYVPDEASNQAEIPILVKANG